MDIIFKHARRILVLDGPTKKQDPADIHEPLYGFGNNFMLIQGTIDLPTIFGNGPREVTSLSKFYIINIASPYYVIVR